MLQMTVSLTTPDYDGDDDLIYDVQLADKRELRRVEKGLIRLLDRLGDIADEKINTGKKPFVGTNPQTTVFSASISKDGADYGGYTFRLPNQTNEARAFLQGAVEGLMAEAGHGNKGKRVAKGKGRA